MVRLRQLTLCGFLCNLAGYVLCLLHCGYSMDCELGSDLLWVCIVLYFGWIVLDNMDGKQARRLNCSSPLGLLFDHQVDAHNVWMTASLISIALSLGNSPLTLLLWTIGAIPFFFATWEELYTGSMDFPCINGPNEGCMFIGGLLMYRAYVGSQSFLQGQWWSWRAKDVLIAGFFLASVINALWNIVRVAVKSEKRKEALVATVSFWYFMLVLLIVYQCSPGRVMEVEARALMICVGCAFAREMGYIQIAHVTDTPYSPLQVGNLSVLTALCANTLAHYFRYSPHSITLVPEAGFLWVLTVMSVALYCHMAYWTTLEISRELQIPVFAVPAQSSDTIQLV